MRCPGVCVGMGVSVYVWTSGLLVRVSERTFGVCGWDEGGGTSWTIPDLASITAGALNNGLCSHAGRDVEEASRSSAEAETGSGAPRSCSRCRLCLGHSAESAQVF